MTWRWIGAAGLILLLGTVATIAQQQLLAQSPAPSPQAQAAAKPANIDRNGVLMLVRSSLLALDQANKTGNYTVLRDLAAPAFQVNSAARLAEIFAKQRNEKLDLSGVAVIDPQLTLLPQIEPSGMMHMAGFFPSRALPGQFRIAVRAYRRPVAALRDLGECGPVGAGCACAAAGRAKRLAKAASGRCFQEAMGSAEGAEVGSATEGVGRWRSWSNSVRMQFAHAQFAKSAAP
jgi:hypothetical protein